ncbi:hypothetical protein IAD21_06226 [Abditibacteriota bacterium]|nr:hypothetical protein IAD21_06226 [Abditibacteriota bacterium]
MRKALLLVLLTGSLAGQTVRAQPGQVETLASVAALVTTLTTPERTWEERFQAEKQLSKMPPVPVMVALVPEIAKGMPTEDGIVGIWNGAGSAELDKKSLPPRWQVFYAVSRVWSAQDMRLSRQKGERATVGKTLVAYLPEARNQVRLLNELGNNGSEGNWVNEAGKPVSALFLDATADPSVRLAALQCLLRHTGEKYYPQAKEVVQAWPEQPWQQLNLKELLMKALLQADLRNRKAKKRTVADADFLRLGFSLLPALENLKDGGGYFLAVSLEDSVSQDFEPDPKNPKYQGQYGLTDAFFADTTKNALAWWKKNRKALP